MYAVLIPGYHACFAKVQGLSAAVLKTYEPPSIQQMPWMYSMPDEGSFAPLGDTWEVDAEHTHRLLHRLVLGSALSEEVAIRAQFYIDAIPNSVRADPTLGHRIAGHARIVGYAFTIGKIASTPFYALDFRSEAVITQGQA